MEATPDKVLKVIAKYPHREQLIIGSFLRAIQREENSPIEGGETKEERSARLRKESIQRYKDKNKARILEYQKQYYLQHKEEIQERKKKKKLSDKK
jgi:hypothetical protein